MQTFCLLIYENTGCYFVFVSRTGFRIIMNVCGYLGSTRDGQNTFQNINMFSVIFVWIPISFGEVYLKPILSRLEI